MVKPKIITTLCLALTIFQLYAQGNSPVSTKVYLDCNRCNNNFIKQEVTIVNYVRDRKVADIHILITDQPMASGGRRYTVNFIGLQDDYDLNYSIDVDTYQTDVEVEVNQRLTGVIQAGLMPYLVTKGPLKMEVTLEQATDKINNSNNEEDPWNFWIFEIGGNIDWEKESNQKEYELEGEIDIERTTELWRIRGELETEYEVNQVKRDDSTLTSSLKRSKGEFSVVKSTAAQWSAGVFGEVRSNTFENIGIGAELQAAVEYNFYPYWLSATKEFTIAYMIGPQYRNYWEETIYDKKEEQLFQQALRINFRLRQPWGSVWARLEGSQYLHDWSKNRLEFNSRVSFQVIKGLFLRIGGEASLVHDQLYLPKGDASLEEILLNRKALATNFELEFNFGIAYTFGSIYNSVVNTRL